jgi:hypothetical protein
MRESKLLTQPLRAGSGGSRRVASELGLTSARGRENCVPTNQPVADSKAWGLTSAHKQPPLLGSVQVRQGSMSRYNQSNQALASQSHLDKLSQTVPHPAAVANMMPPATTVVRECRTPVVPSWPRAASPDTRRCTLGSIQQPIKAQAICSSTPTTALPPPRLAATQPPRSSSSGTSLPHRLTATPTPAPAAASQHVWAYPTSASTVYRGCDERRRSSVGAYYARATA